MFLASLYNIIIYNLCNRDYMSVHFNHIRLISTCNQVLVNDSDRSDTIVHSFEGMYCT